MRFVSNGVSKSFGWVAIELLYRKSDSTDISSVFSSIGKQFFPKRVIFSDKKYLATLGNSYRQLTTRFKGILDFFHSEISYNIECPLTTERRTSLCSRFNWLVPLNSADRSIQRANFPLSVIIANRRTIERRGEKERKKGISRRERKFARYVHKSVGRRRDSRVPRLDLSLWFAEESRVTISGRVVRSFSHLGGSDLQRHSDK